MKWRNLGLGIGISFLIFAVVRLAAVPGEDATESSVATSIITNPRENLLAIHTKASKIMDTRLILWEKWRRGEITAKELYDNSIPLVNQLEELITLVQGSKVPNALRDAYEYYRAFLVESRDVIERTYRYALDKERGNFRSPEAEASALNLSTGSLERAAYYLNLSRIAMTVTIEQTTRQIQETKPKEVEKKLRILDTYYEKTYYGKESRPGIETRYTLYVMFQTENPPLTIKRARLNYLPTGLNNFLDVNLRLNDTQPVKWESREFDFTKEPYEFDIYFETEPTATLERESTQIHVMPKALRDQVVGSRGICIFIETSLWPGERRIVIVRTHSCKDILYTIEFYSTDGALLGQMRTYLRAASESSGGLLPIAPKPAYVLVKSQLGEWRIPVVEAKVKIG